MKNSKKKLAIINTLLKFVLKQVEKGDSCFFDYSGHVNLVRIRRYRGEWNDKKIALFNDSVFLEHITDDEFEQWANNAMSKIQTLAPAN